MIINDYLYLKRFCLPCNTDIGKLISIKNYKKDSLINYNDYNHVACIVKTTKIKFNKNQGIMITKPSILSIGVNSYGDVNGDTPGVHAEVDAFNKLTHLYNKKKTNIDLIILRLSSTNKLQNSKPCNNCVNKLYYLPHRKGYKLNNIYYSHELHYLIQTTLSSLINENAHVSKFYRRNKNLNHT